MTREEDVDDRSSTPPAHARYDREIGHHTRGPAIPRLAPVPFAAMVRKVLPFQREGDPVMAGPVIPRFRNEAGAGVIEFPPPA
jgi:hypothetical protein